MRPDNDHNDDDDHHDLNDRGASMTEYALLLLVVFIVALVAVLAFGDAVVALFEGAPQPMTPSPNVSTTSN